MWQVAVTQYRDKSQKPIALFYKEDFCANLFPNTLRQVGQIKTRNDFAHMISTRKVVKLALLQHVYTSAIRQSDSDLSLTCVEATCYLVCSKRNRFVGLVLCLNLVSWITSQMICVQALACVTVLWTWATHFTLSSQVYKGSPRVVSESRFLKGGCIWNYTLFYIVDKLKYTEK